MSDKAKIAIVGFGNIGKAVLNSVNQNNELHGDMEPVGIITRDPARTCSQLPDNSGVSSNQIYTLKDEKAWTDLDADVAILCGGSKEDLPHQGPIFARNFNTVDSFDTHKDIAGYFATMSGIARAEGTLSLVSGGWDPGTFSLERVLGNAFIPGSNPRGFYGLDDEGGLSMGHGDAIRKVKGVADARQYTHAIHESMEDLESDGKLELAPGQMHWRECVVVLENDTTEERERVSGEIQSMPKYFNEYRTEVEFTTQENLDANYSEMHHDGAVITSGNTADGNRGSIEYRNTWPSNPDGTAGILTACARAVHKMSKDGQTGAITMLDVPASKYSPHSRQELLKKFM